MFTTLHQAEHQLMMGKSTERTNRKFRCPISCSAIGQAGCLILRTLSSTDIPVLLLNQLNWTINSSVKWGSRTNVFYLDFCSHLFEGSGPNCLIVLCKILLLPKVITESISVIPKWPQKQSKQHQSSFSRDYVITLQTPRDIFIEILALWDCRPLWSTCDPHAARLSTMALASWELDSLVRVPGVGGGGSTSLWESNGDVPLDEVAFSWLDWL